VAQANNQTDLKREMKSQQPQQPYPKKLAADS